MFSEREREIHTRTAKNMDRQGNLKQHCYSNTSYPSLPLPIMCPDSSFNNFLSDSKYDYYPGLEMKYPTAGHTSETWEAAGRDKYCSSSQSSDSYNLRKRKNDEFDVKKKKNKLTYEQVEALERSFEEDTIKLEPEKKMKLAMELGLDPKQIAVWFQNRRARWKAKHLEKLYINLQHKYDVVSREKHKLHQEVLALKALMKEQASKNQLSREVTVESTSLIGHQNSGRLWDGSSHQHVISGGNNVAAEDCNLVGPWYWSSVLQKSCLH